MKFKPGDKARVIGNTTAHGFDQGEEITIQAGADESAFDYDATNDKGDEWYMRDCDLEPIESVQEEESKVDLQKLEDKFKALFENETEESFNMWLCSRLEGTKRPDIGDHMVNIDFEATEKLQFEMHKTVDMICEKTKVSYQDAANVYFLATIAQLASTISRLKSEIEELKRKA